jgi:lipoate-protein ligase A
VPERTVNEDLLDLHETGQAPVWRIHEPTEVFAVLGAGGDAERDLLVDNLRKRGIAWHRRKGGGGAVVLSPGQTVLALVTEVKSPFRNREYAAEINSWFVEALSPFGIGPIESRGISDLAIAGRKILGASIYRRKLLLFYQASLLVSNDLTLFESYLTPPHRAPDYRKGRGHAEFCTTLRNEGYPVTVEETIAALEKTVKRRIGALA